MRGRAATAVPLLKRPGRGPRLCTALRSLTPPRCSLAWTWPSCLARVGSSLRAVTPTSRISSRRLSTPPPPPRTTPETCLPGTSGRSSPESTSAAPLRSPPAACFCGTCLGRRERLPQRRPRACFGGRGQSAFGLVDQPRRQRQRRQVTPPAAAAERAAGLWLPRRSRLHRLQGGFAHAVGGVRESGSECWHVGSRLRGRSKRLHRPHAHALVP
mmetsp:Transcript_14685/g.47503  ORF Transcript_14685/g.47503 Transcript_14685/m.47503 type:complete len:214 (-) Transcript_14685:622-1263(-)